MEFLGALFAGGAAAGASTATAGAATAAAGAGTGLASLSGIGSVFSAVASIGSGIAGMASASAEAKQHEFAARDEFIAGRETSAALKKELADTIANNAVAFAGGGVDLGSVSVETAKAQARKDAEAELSLNDASAATRMMARRRAARNSRARGAWGMVTSIATAGQELWGAGQTQAAV